MIQSVGGEEGDELGEHDLEAGDIDLDLGPQV